MEQLLWHRILKKRQFVRFCRKSSVEPKGLTSDTLLHPQTGAAAMAHA